jgi:hypothetical protein
MHITEPEKDKLYSSRDQTVRFGYVTSLRVEGKQIHVAAMQIKDITDIGTDTASYEVLPLVNNVYCMDSICSLTCYLSHPSDPPAFYL